MKYCDYCGSKLKIIYKAVERQISYMDKEGYFYTKRRKVFWRLGKIIPQEIWIERYQKFIKKLDEDSKERFTENIKITFQKYFICSNPACAIEIEDRYWVGKEAIRMTSWKGLRN